VAYGIGDVFAIHGISQSLYMQILRRLLKVVVVELKSSLELPTEESFWDLTLVVSLVLYKRFHAQLLEEVMLVRECKPIRIVVFQWHRKLIIAM
jgi:predicted nicotinamide N-methyase